MADLKQVLNAQERAEIEALFPQPTETGVGSITVRPLDMDTCFFVFQKLEPIVLDVLSAFPGGVSEIDGGVSVGEEFLQRIVKTVAKAEYQKQFIEAIARAVNKSEAYVSALPFTASIKLTMKVYEINKDFFILDAGDIASGVMMTIKANQPVTLNDGAGPTH